MPTAPVPVTPTLPVSLTAAQFDTLAAIPPSSSRIYECICTYCPAVRLSLDVHGGSIYVAIFCE
jgi:hypothetical protein